MHYVEVFAAEDAIRYLGVENAPSDDHAIGAACRYVEQLLGGAVERDPDSEVEPDNVIEYEEYAVAPALREAIERIQRMRDETLREMIAGPVADVLAHDIRDERAAKQLRSEPYPEWDACHAEAVERVAAMSDEELDDTWQEVSDDYWETAKSEEHEWYDQATGELQAFDRVLDVLQALAPWSR